MNISSKFLPYGALPYDNIKFATAAMAKLYQEIPYLPDLPLISESDSIKSRTLSCFPGVVIKDGNIRINVGSTEYRTVLTALNETFFQPTLGNLEIFGMQSVFLDKYLHMIKKFKPPYAVMHLLGPLTLSEILSKSVGEKVITDRSFRKLLIQVACVKALWSAKKIKHNSSETIPIIIFEEPDLGKIGSIKRENSDITNELITNIYSKILEKLKKSHNIIGIQCFEKCDWSIPIDAGFDLISFNAYDCPNNLNIIPEQIESFLKNGGIINWAIVPVNNEQIVKDLTSESLVKRFKHTADGLITAGVSPELIYKNLTVSVNGNLDNLPIFFAEKVLTTLKQFAGKLF